jgi:hypothetical protein
VACPYLAAGTALRALLCGHCSAGTALRAPLADPGDVMSPPPKGTMSGRVAFATVLAGTAAECQAALDAAQAALIIEPADPDPTTP